MACGPRGTDSMDTYISKPLTSVQKKAVVVTVSGLGESWHYEGN